MPIGSQWFANPSSGFDTTLIGNSVWLDGSADGLTKTGFDDEDGKEFTIATWFQINQTGVSEGLMCAGNGSGTYTSLRHDDDNKIYFQTEQASEILKTAALYRDTAWYHVLVSVDTTQGTDTDRVKIYVNGVQATLSGTYPAEDFVYEFNSANVHEVGDSYENGAFKGYVAQSFMIGSKSIQQSDFAITDFLDVQTFGTNGSQYIPKKSSQILTLVNAGSDNSFLLEYANSSALGTDSSDYTNTFTATSMAAANQSTNTPSKMYPTINYIDHSDDTLPTLSSGNLTSAGPGAGRACMRVTLAIPTTGKWYWEANWDSVASSRVGFAESSSFLDAACGGTALSWGIQNDGKVVNDNSEGSALFTWSTDDRIAMAYNADTSKFWFGQIADGADTVTWASSGDPAADSNETVASVPSKITPALDTNTGTVSLKFPSSSWNLASVPSGFEEITSADFTAPSYQGIDYFNAVKYAGNGTAIGSGGKAVTGTGFQPDFVWMKNRDQADSHGLYDAVRGTTKQIESDTNAVETTESEGLTAFGSDGFTVGSLAQLNTNTENYVAWQWLGGNATSTDENGSIDSTVSVADAGHFSIVTWEGSGGDATVGHGMSGAPTMVLTKDRDVVSTWLAWQDGLTSAQYFMNLDTTGAEFDNGASGYYRGTAPSSTVITMNGSTYNTSGSNLVAYCFRSIAGVCKVGSYTGNGAADGPYISTGFKPRYIIWKNVDVARDWGIIDTATQTYNPGTLSSVLFANLNNADGDGTQGASGTAYNIDILADGFKIRVGDSGPNGDGNDFIYMAMADIGGGGTLPPIYGR